MNIILYIFEKTLFRRLLDKVRIFQDTPNEKK